MLQEQRGAEPGYDIDDRAGQHQAVLFPRQLPQTVEQRMPLRPGGRLARFLAVGIGAECHQIAGPLAGEFFGGHPQRFSAFRVHDAGGFGRERLEHHEMQVAPGVDHVEDHGFGQPVQPFDFLFVRFIGGSPESDLPAGVEDALDAGACLRRPRRFPDEGQRHGHAVVPRNGSDAGGGAVGDVVLSDGCFHWSSKKGGSSPSRVFSPIRQSRSRSLADL